MNAFERKIIHTALQGDKNVVTNSEGDEPFRHVVITYKNNIVVRFQVTDILGCLRAAPFIL